MKRREFIKTGLLTSVAAGLLIERPQTGIAGLTETVEGCQVTPAGTAVALDAPSFQFKLDTSVGLAAVTWVNKLSGKAIPLGSDSELEVDLDRADERIQIPGWKGTVSIAGTTDCDEDSGYKEGFASPGFDDSKWRGMINLTLGEASPASFTWARTGVTIPSSAQDKPLSLTLGGFGLFDHRFMRVFLNGKEVGRRRTTGRWHEPLVVDFGPESDARALVRFGQTNLVAVQLSEFINRPAHLDELDPSHTQKLPGSLTWPGSPAQFEQYFTVGSPPVSVTWRPARLVSKKDGPIGEVVFALNSDEHHLAGLVTYRWAAGEPVLHKFVEIVNDGMNPVRILNVRLGGYQTETSVSEGEQGFPVYVQQDFFLGLAHPYGWATGQDGRVRLYQYPGTRVNPGQAFQCMEAVYGVAKEGEARNSFLTHLKGRMRRVVRGHDKPYAIFDAFGGQSRNSNVVADYNESEEYLLDNISKVARGQRESGCHFDIYSLDFWVDYHGDLTQADPARFPHGFTKIIPALNDIGTQPGLWIDSSYEAWSVGGNPSVKSDLCGDPQYDTVWMALCRASEPIKSMYSRAFRYHIRENGVRLVKFDNFRPLCYNPRHDHLPGVYSTEAIGSAVIGTLRDLDAENPDVFLMLYWGYLSPWWLLHADTLFESGLAMEASSPGPSPTLYARDGVTVGLDQAQWYCVDVPQLGKDSLGVWLSDWDWNSSIGKERWQEGMVMDLCRGSLLAQPFSDTAWLSPPERKQMADFIALLKERPDCFGNPLFILGNPWKNEPYGYVCSNGRRAFIALNNCTWKDVALKLQLSQAWGLPEKVAWDIYRWHPHPAQLVDNGGRFANTVPFSLRPFEVVLLEVVTAGTAPSLGRHFPTAALPISFEESSQELILANNPSSSRGTTVKGEVPPCELGGMLVITTQMFKGPVAVVTQNGGKHFHATGMIGGEPTDWHAVLGNSIHSTSWQSWHRVVEASALPQPFQFSITNDAEIGNDVEVELASRGYFFPR